MPEKLWPVYNVESSVGRAGSNRMEDVMLVQFFLSKVAAAPNLPLRPPSTPLVPNGFYTPLVDDWITWYQKALNRVGKQVAVDGRIDRAKGELHETNFTIMHLNASYRRRYRKSHDAIDEDPLAPGALRAKFRADDLTPA